LSGGFAWNLLPGLRISDQNWIYRTMVNEPNETGREGEGKDATKASSGRFVTHSTRILRHHIPTEFILLGFIEVIALILSFYVGLELRFGFSNWTWQFAEYLPSALIFSLVMLSVLIAFGAYQRQVYKSTNLLAVRIASSLFLGLIVLSMTYYVAPMFFLGRGALALAVFVSFVSIMAIRLSFFRIMKAYDLRLRLLILGAGKVAGLVKEAESDGVLDGLRIMSYMPMPGDKESNKRITLVNTPGALTKYVDENNIDVIVLAMDERRKGLPVHELLDCKMGGIEVIDLLTFFERYTSKIRLDIISPSWLFLSEGFQVSILRRLMKRVFDIFSVLLLIPLVLPLFLLSALAILVEGRGKGPIFYAQTRVGEYGRHFQIYKFRSMVVDAERNGKAQWAQKRDDRITRVGQVLRKFRIDELPQLYNILRGDMSFIGPRPERPEFVKRLTEQIPYYDERHRVKPGLSGWAQIRYAYGASAEDGLEKLQYDLYYVKNYSILLDALILLQTAEVVLLGRGAH
jgi:sugar transferase (PEP-CTERM system associated)